MISCSRACRSEKLYQDSSEFNRVNFIPWELCAKAVSP